MIWELASTLCHYQFKQLGIGEVRPIIITIQLADRSHAYPKGKIDDVLIKVNKFIFLLIL